MKKEQLKSAFRTLALKGLKKAALSPSKRALDAKVNHALKTLLKELDPHSILFFYPLPLEPDIRPTIALFRRQKRVRLYLPFMQDVSFEMVPLRLPLFTKKFGVKEPSFSHFNHHRVEVVVVPIVGTDRSLRRIGYGKGMYDRFFSRLQNKPITIFIARSLFFSPQIITQGYDVQADIIITGDGALLKGNQYDRVDYIKLPRLRALSRGRNLPCLQKGKQR